MEKENSDLALTTVAPGDGTPTTPGGASALGGGSIKDMFLDGVKSIETQRCVLRKKRAERLRRRAHSLQRARTHNFLTLSPHPTAAPTTCSSPWKAGI